MQPPVEDDVDGAGLLGPGLLGDGLLDGVRLGDGLLDVGALGDGLAVNWARKVLTSAEVQVRLPLVAVLPSTGLGVWSPSKAAH